MKGRVLVTGAAGFIGSATSIKLIELGYTVVGIDNINDYYDVNLKLARLERVKAFEQFKFVKLDIADRDAIEALFAQEQFDYVIHLAAQAGVRYSIDNPHAYAESNLVGHLHILEGCRQHKVKHLVYASSSSVYGLNSKTPFSTSDSVDHPISLYAATKKSNELMSHTYSHLYNIPTTGLRFFTVYGPWGRPDMALFKFTKSILNGEPIDIYNNGDLSRDFTYIDDIVDGVVNILSVLPQGQKNWTVETGSAANSSAPYAIYNIGNGNPVKLMDFVKALENALGTESIKNFMPMQDGDVYQTFADTEDFVATTGVKSNVDVQTGINNFVDWYQSFYGETK
ncbi:NAD-dependent epimerase [Marinicellulosiphila megalodicopiae]|uniref:NAD-dependent epimerase n=1 Tax=Marinicellulosiphila megalodicopiae TaxID=2724896 RepID=UPI003BAE7AF0